MSFEAGGGTEVKGPRRDALLSSNPDWEDHELEIAIVMDSSRAKREHSGNPSKAPEGVTAAGL